MAVKLIPLAKRSKSPLKGRSWKTLVSDDLDVHEGWIREGLNLGFPAGANNAVVVDFDCKEMARAFYARYRSLLGPLTETRHGIHAFFAGNTRPRKLILNDEEVGDIRAGDTYVVFPNSRVWYPDEQVLTEYRFIPGHDWGELPPFPAELFPDVRRSSGTTSRKEVKNIDAYLAKIESHQGKHGSGGLVRAAARCRDANLSEAEAMAKLLVWNAGPTVNPPWSVEELARAVTRVYAKGKR